MNAKIDFLSKALQAEEDEDVKKQLEAEIESLKINFQEEKKQNEKLYNKKTALQSRLIKRTEIIKGETAANATKVHCDELITIIEEEVGVCCRESLIFQLQGLPLKRSNNTQSDLASAFKSFLGSDN